MDKTRLAVLHRIYVELYLISSVFFHHDRLKNPSLWVQPEGAWAAGKTKWRVDEWVYPIPEEATTKLLIGRCRQWNQDMLSCCSCQLTVVCTMGLKVWMPSAYSVTRICAFISWATTVRADCTHFLGSTSWALSGSAWDSFHWGPLSFELALRTEGRAGANWLLFASVQIIFKL